MQAIVETDINVIYPITDITVGIIINKKARAPANLHTSVLWHLFPVREIPFTLSPRAFVNGFSIVLTTCFLSKIKTAGQS